MSSDVSANTSGRYGSGGLFEEKFGYSRLVVAGPNAYVSGSTAVTEGVVHYEGDPYRQTLSAFNVSLDALSEAGFARADVVRTRMYVVHPRDMEEVGRAHKELFDAVRPAATMVVISKLIDPRMLVEVEVDAYRDTPREARR
jgi:enamine deaminase RidA (YjgF/YER057c/UK114 family)